MDHETVITRDYDGMPVTLDFVFWRNGHVMRISQEESCGIKTVTLFPELEIA